MNTTASDQLTRAYSVVSRFSEHRRMLVFDIHSRCTHTITVLKNSQEKHNGNLHTANRTLITAWRQYTTEQIAKNRDQGHLFNPLFFFDICETKHSELLGYLLKPWEKHGQGNTFLTSFLDMLGVPDPDKGDWHPTIERGRIDILLKRTTPYPSVIIIENKSNGADDQPNQLYRYWHKAIHPIVGDTDYNDTTIKQNFQVIYLPSHNEKKPAEHSTQRPDHIPLDKAGGHEILPLECQIKDFNTNIADWLQRVASCIPPTNIRLKAYLEFYTELCKSL